MSQGCIISLGSVNADFQVRVERRPDLSETLLAHDFMQLSGGKAANVAYLARKLEKDALLIAHVGTDALAEQALKPLQEIGVNLQYVHRIEGQPTGVSMITVPPDGQKGIILAANANYVWSAEDIAGVQEAIVNAPVGSVLVVDYEVPPFIVEAAITAARQRGFPVILDPSPADRVDAALLPQVSYLVPDAGEAEKLTGIQLDSPKAAMQAAHQLWQQGVQQACVKLKDGGCVVVSQEQKLHIAPVPVPVVDSTGAGDAFAGALAVAVREGQSLPDAARFATAASHLTVTRYGSQPAYPSRTEIDSMLERLADHVHLF
ncbi:MAG: ribokinase [Elainella sp. C42_A2020_010]|nr:ribokinase [Elainella sp. C42_A2020_010]RNJ68634.1 MAG: ribokinase [Leptolyngbya sp. IPPAS B-1204]